MWKSGVKWNWSWKHTIQFLSFTYLWWAYAGCAETTRSKAYLSAGVLCRLDVYCSVTDSNVVTTSQICSTPVADHNFLSPLYFSLSTDRLTTVLSKSPPLSVLSNWRRLLLMFVEGIGLDAPVGSFATSTVGHYFRTKTKILFVAPDKARVFCLFCWGALRNKFLFHLTLTVFTVFFTVRRGWVAKYPGILGLFGPFHVQEKTPIHPVVFHVICIDITLHLENRYVTAVG